MSEEKDLKELSEQITDAIFMHLAPSQLSWGAFVYDIAPIVLKKIKEWEETK